MALLYRAIWQDSSADLALSHKVFAHWVTTKYPDLVVPEDGIGITPTGEADVLIDRAHEDRFSVMKAALHEEREGSRWTTTLISIVDGDQSPTLWVDLEFVAEDSFRTPDIIAPRLVADPFHYGGRAQRGPTLLRDIVQVWAPKNVTDLATNILEPTRDVPIIVFSAASGEQPSDLLPTAAAAASILAGVAIVEVLPPESVDCFRDIIGREFAVWGGAARTYLPQLDRQDRPSRHPVLTRARMRGGDRQAGRFLGRRLSAAVAARRAPTSWPRARHLLDSRGAKGVEELETMLDDSLLALETAREQIRAAEDRWVDAVADQEQLNSEVTEKTETIAQLTCLLSTAGISADKWVSAMHLHLRDEQESHGNAEIYALSVTSCREAASVAVSRLRGVAVPQEALRDLEDLDAAMEGRAWASTAWRGFRSLDAYANEAADYKGFWHWCEHSPSPYIWPANSKKLAMRESETVMANPQLSMCRRLPVHKKVEPSGYVMMEAHMKIAEGGGPLAPRIYFYDDTAGKTGQVHVGFFGPHRYMPNTRSN